MDRKVHQAYKLLTASDQSTSGPREQDQYEIGYTKAWKQVPIIVPEEGEPEPNMLFLVSLDLTETTFQL